MKSFYPLIAILLLLSFKASAQTAKSQEQLPYTVHNRTIEQITEGDLAILRFSEANGAGLAWIKNTEFTDGTIEFDARGRNVLQKSFLGIALHGKDNETYETIYLRPFNFQATDSTRRVHAVQYAFEPKFGFQQLRNTHKDQYESAILPANINPSDWFHVKVEVKADQITVFLNGNKQPCLEVKSLNPNPSGKMIGFWVGNSSNGDFANFKLTKYKVSR